MVSQKLVHLIQGTIYVKMVLRTLAHSIQCNNLHNDFTVVNAFYSLHQFTLEWFLQKLAHLFNGTIYLRMVLRIIYTCVS